jgi:hypothetical protein
MLPFWEVGLHEYEDFVDFAGKKLLTFEELKLKHPRAKFNGRHRKARALLAYRMGCTPSGGLLPCHQITPRKKGDIENILRDYPERDVWEDDLKERRRMEEEEENNLDHLHGVPRPSRVLPGGVRRFRKKTRRRKRKLSDRVNPDQKELPTSIQTFSYENILSKRNIQGQSQWQVEWTGVDAEGNQFEPTWEVEECFDGMEHPDVTLRRYRSGEVRAVKDKVRIRPKHSNHAWHGQRVKAIIHEQDDRGTYTRPVWYEGSIYVNSDKTAPDTKPFVIEYDDPDESDEEVDPFDGDDSISPMRTDILVPTWYRLLGVVPTRYQRGTTNLTRHFSRHFENPGYSDTTLVQGLILFRCGTSRIWICGLL